MFCKKCGSLLVPKKVNNKTVLSCSCGYSSQEGMTRTEKVLKKENTDIKIKEQEIEINAKVEEKCPKCGYHEAYFWEQQTRAPDEAATKFFKCVKCKHVWKDYG